jgi:quinol monooxygenase YgiN
MVTKGLIVLRDAVPLVEEEPETIAWFAISLEGPSFAIVDAFPDERGRSAHLAGPVAAALAANAEDLLAGPPEIQHVDLLGAKLPALERRDG